MIFDNNIRKRINELCFEKKTTLCKLALNGCVTPSTLYEFMAGKSKSMTFRTLKLILDGANITLLEFFSNDYFNEDEDI